MTDKTIKGLEKAKTMDGSALRVAIVHARWNREVIDALVAGAVATLKSQGVRENNIVVQTVPGSFELPFAVQRYASCYLVLHELTSDSDIASLPARMYKQEQRLRICSAA